MTWEDFARAGYAIDRSTCPPRLDGPRGLLADLRFELAMRAAVVGNGSDYAVTRGRYGFCSHCGDELASAHVAGTCGLCELARAKALREASS